MTEASFGTHRLKDIAATPIVNGLGEPAAEGEEGWPRYIRITDFSTLTCLDPAKRETLPPEIAARAPVKKNDLLMAAVGATVGTAYIHTTDELACFAGYLVRLRTDPRIAVPKFVAYWTQTSDYWTQIKSGSIGSTIENFSASRYRTMRLPLPTIDIQQRTVALLDRETGRIDELIAKQEQLITLLAERRQASITQAVTKGLNPNVELKDSGTGHLGHVPVTWSVSRLKSLILSHASGVSVNAMDTPAEPDELGVLKTGSVSTGRFRPSHNKVVAPAETAALRCPVTKQTILVNRANTPTRVGAAVFVEEDIPHLFLSDKIWEVRTTGVLEKFIVAWMQTDQYRGQVGFSAVGASLSMQNLSFADFRNFDVPRPPLHEQREIMTHLDGITSQVDRLSKKSAKVIKLLKERRQVLISAAVTGKIDVREM